MGSLLHLNVHNHTHTYMHHNQITSNTILIIDEMSLGNEIEKGIPFGYHQNNVVLDE